MSTKYFDDVESLVNAVQEKANRILSKYVAPVAEEVFKQHIKSDIYDAYTPKENGWVIRKNGGFHRATYQRRNDLADKVTSRMLKKDTLLITSTARARTPLYGTFRHSEGSFLNLLETGNMGLWKHGFPRPVVANSELDFGKNTAIERAITRGIEKEL